MNVLPEGYKPQLDFFETEKGIKLIKDNFEKLLAKRLNLIRVSAPRFLKYGDGLQDDLAGTQSPISFNVNFTSYNIEVVHSLAKWKRFALKKYGFKIGSGLYTDMDAIRRQEDVSPIHSIYVDQWDWEKIISKEGRTIQYLTYVVNTIYSIILDIQTIVSCEFPLFKNLPDHISFIHSEHLESLYPSLSPKQRERKIAQHHGAVFIIGIGHELPINKVKHDIRACDYDDWSTETGSINGLKTYGLNGDIIVWDSVRQDALELSSMGIRVNSESLNKQMIKMNKLDPLKYHDMIMNDELPQTIGGGIGQSRLCMFLLQKAHIGEVQSSVWPEEVKNEFNAKGIPLL